MELSGFGERLAKLLSAKNVSARAMSLALGKSENYINKIENGKSLPGMQSFFEICEYLKISQKDFYDEGNNYPERLEKVVSHLKMIDEKNLSYIEGIAGNLNPYNRD